MIHKILHFFTHAAALSVEKILIFCQLFLCRKGYLLFDLLDSPYCEANDCYTLYTYLKKNKRRVLYIVQPHTSAYEKAKQDGGLDDGSIFVLNCSAWSLRSVWLLFPRALCYNIVATSHGRINFIWARVWKHSPFCRYIHTQHGMVWTSSRSLASVLSPKHFDYAVISGEKEEQLFMNHGWKDYQLIRSGLFRYDNMCNAVVKNNKQIMIMFTWRSSFDSNESDSFSVEKSTYYRKLFSLLQNQTLLSKCKLENIRLVFAPHHYFLAKGKGTIEVPNTVYLADSTGLSEIVRTADLLVTDYSSISFDFLFQNKPVIYYRLDDGDVALNAKDREAQEEMKTRDYALINVAYSEDEVLRLIFKYIDNGWQLSEQEKYIASSFFYSKTGACERFVATCDKL